MATPAEIEAARRELARRARLKEVDAEIARRARLKEVDAEIARRKQTARSEAMGGPFTDPEEQRVLDLRQELTLIGVGVAAGMGTLGWLLARRTLLASRPHLSRKWFGVFGPVMWRCGRCGNQIALEKARCETCGQYQKWPKWSTEA